MNEPCPATGGDHVWIEELPEDYYLLSGHRRSTRAERTHCEECDCSYIPEEDDASF